MERKFKITVDGMPYIVTVEELSSSAEARMLPAQSAAAQAPAAIAAPPREIPPPAATGPSSPDDKLSPLGGVVVSVDVAVGQTVTEGQKVLTIEAMKMKTAVGAHKAGKVTRIAVKPGDPVEAGQPLVTIS